MSRPFFSCYSRYLEGDSWTEADNWGFFTFLINTFHQSTLHNVKYNCCYQLSASIVVYKGCHFYLLDPPTIKAATTSTTTSWIGQTVKLACESDGVPTPTLTWAKPGGSPIKSVTATQNTADVKMSVDQDFGVYTCNAHNGLTPADFKMVKIGQISRCFFMY